jgi:hypothetical protein
MTTQVDVRVPTTSAHPGSHGVPHYTANAFGGFQDLCRVLRPGEFIVIGLYNTYGRLLWISGAPECSALPSRG